MLLCLDRVHQLQSIAYLDQLEQLYPCQTAETAMRLRKRGGGGGGKKAAAANKLPTVPTAYLPRGSSEAAEVQAALELLAPLLKLSPGKSPVLQSVTLSDVAGDWLAAPLQGWRAQLDVDAQQELFYAGADSIYYSQTPLQLALSWDAATRLRVLDDGDPKASPLPLSLPPADVAQLWRSRLDRSQLDRLDELLLRLAPVLSEADLSLLAELAPDLDASAADAFTREGQNKNAADQQLCHSFWTEPLLSLCRSQSRVHLGRLGSVSSRLWPHVGAQAHTRAVAFASP